MVDKIAFMETLHAVKEITKTSAEPLSKEEILGYFKDMDLSAEQQEMVVTFIQTPEEDPADAEDSEEDAKEADGTKEAADYEDTDELDETGAKKAEAKQEEAQDYMPHSVFFQMYLEDLEAIKNCSKEEEQALYQKLLAGDDTVIRKLSDNWLKRVLEMAKGHASPKVNLEDVIQEGNIGLFMTLQELCGRGTVADIEREIRNGIEESMKAYISETTGEDDSENTVLAKVTLVHEAQKLLAEESGQTPTLKELSDYTRIPEQEIADILAMAKEVKR